MKYKICIIVHSESGHRDDVPTFFIPFFHFSSSFGWFVKRFYTKALGKHKTCIILQYV